ncbi:MAG: hypothetical protein ACFCUU_04855 [Cyclobacteriaceae bacterium]
MKKVFDINRFGKLLRYDYNVNKWEYILLLPVSLAILWYALFSMFKSTVDGSFTSSYYLRFFLTGYFLLGIFLNSKSYGALRNRLSAATYLALPASVFEKFFLHWFLRITLFTAIYPVLFYVGVNVFIPIFTWATKAYISFYGLSANIADIPAFSFDVLIPGEIEGQILLTAIFIAIFVLSIFQLGSIVYGKWNLVKTILAIAVMFLILHYYVRFIAIFLGGVENIRTVLFGYYIIESFLTLSLIVCWVATYLKLKEREV